MIRSDLTSFARPKRHPARAESLGASAVGAGTAGAFGVGAMSAGALAVGAAAIGALAIGRLAIKRAAVERLEIEELVVRRLQVDTRSGISRESVAEWIDAYERAWRTPGTDALLTLFTPKATYSPGPFEPTLQGLAAIAEFWDAQRDDDESFTLESEPIALDGITAVVRTQVGYPRPVPREYRNLWVIEFAPDGRVQSFAEWPFSPERDVAAPRPDAD
ncbi:nuclear transport factor 2 family protein [Conexibacter sp. CPCC 206217]|uniref:nuclear transport factor 2 family protein n=1 Tax=Conexibacter sp. CPCC 206217 TaxID=3064574 RepID=UPI002715D28A|nr:nuclear transport factor 2 family protein [Conexibacter sp. CPCC 206217]MDO8211261.1 nuclear transport factor 2 family protein [Conexibacter sp. CPCC 206217]